MFKRKGSMPKFDKDAKPMLKANDGKVFEVSYIVAFVWENLDGNTELEKIDQEIKRITKNDDDEVENISHNVVSELEKVDLVEQIEAEANA